MSYEGDMSVQKMLTEVRLDEELTVKRDPNGLGVLLELTTPVKSVRAVIRTHELMMRQDTLESYLRKMFQELGGEGR